MENEKSKGQILEEKLLSKPKSLGEIENTLLEQSREFCEGYKEFLSHKTEREIVDYVVPMLEKKGYKEFRHGTEYVAGDKVYMVNRGKTLIMVTVGRRGISEGARIGVSHIDSPRLDFKPNPLFESMGMAYFKTHYYGGIKKYQWFAIPLSLHASCVSRTGAP